MSNNSQRSAYDSSNSVARHFQIRTIVALSGALICTWFGLSPARAQDATWLAAPGSGDYNTGANWSTGTVPTGTASFGASGTTALSSSAAISADGWTFGAVAPAYTFTNNDLLTFTGTGIVINGGSLALTNGGTGTLNFLNASSAGSAAIINNGNVNFLNTSSADRALITNNANLNFRDGSSAANATIANNGFIQFFGSSSAGNANLTNNSGGTTYFLDSSTAGNAHITDNWSLVFFNASTAGNATVVSSSSLAFHDSSTAGNSNITVNGSASFLDNSSAGSSNITNNSTMLFDNTSSAGSATIANTSVLEFLTNSSAGSATISNANHSDLLFYGNSTAGNATIVNNYVLVLFDNATLGNAAVTSNAVTLVDISASSGPAGDGKLSVGSLAGAGGFYLGGNQLTVGSNNLSTTVSGKISDCGTGAACEAALLGLLTPTTGGSLVKVGTGTLTLAGNNSYTGATIVNGGTLAVNGSIASSALTTVNAGGTLAGNGTVGNTLINGGTLSPGNSVGTLTVQGNLVFSSAARYMVEVASSADRVNVTGNATLGGASVNVGFAASSYLTKQYTILTTTGTVDGTFNAAVNTNMPANVLSSLSYDAHDVYLNNALNYDGLPGLNANQRAVGNALTNYFNSAGGIPMAFATLSPAGLTQASGETATGAQQTTFDAMNLFMGVMIDPFSAGRGPTPPSAMGYASADPRNNANAMFTKAMKAPAGFDARWNVWAAGYGGSQATDGNTATGSNNTNSSVYGTAVGADYWFSPSTIAGFSLAGGGTNFAVTNGGYGRSDLFQAGAFVRHNEGAAYVTAALAYGWQDITTNRTVTIAGVDQLRAEYNANSYSARVEGGNRFIAPWIKGLGITPYAAAQVTAFDLPGYSESVVSGAGTFALAYSAKTATDTRTELGVRTDTSYVLADEVLTLRGRAAWAHDYNPDRNVAATFQALPGASFVVNGAAQAADAALTSASAEIKFASGFSLATTFEGEFSDVTRSYAGKGVVRYQW